MAIDEVRLARTDLPPGALLPSDAGYDEARISFNGMIDRRPAAIVTCASTADVVAAVRAARAAGLPIAIRGGGHSVAGHGLADGAIVVDLRGMRTVTVDPERRVARAGGGALWEDVDPATVAHGLATTGGTFGDTGIGGLTLTGGIGYLMGTHGFTCDNLVAAEMVTASGDVVTAGPDGDPELLWALRGGGGNFGVVTEFVYAIHPLPPLHMGGISVPLRHAREALRAADALVRTAPPEANVFVVGPAYELVDGVPPDPASAPPVVRIALAFQGSAAGAQELIRPLRALPGAKGDIVPATYQELQGRTGKLPFGLRHYWKGHFVRELDGPAIEAAVIAMETTPAGHSFVLLEAISGQARSEPAGGAAFGQRQARWNASALAIWEDPADDDAHRDWARRMADGLIGSSLTGAGYVNYSTEETPDRVRAAFGDGRWDRLVAVKRRYDPDNVFRFNHNIRPD